MSDDGEWRPYVSLYNNLVAPAIGRGLRYVWNNPREAGLTFRDVFQGVNNIREGRWGAAYNNAWNIGERWSGTYNPRRDRSEETMRLYAGAGSSKRFSRRLRRGYKARGKSRFSRYGKRKSYARRSAYGRRKLVKRRRFGGGGRKFRGRRRRFGASIKDVIAQHKYIRRDIVDHTVAASQTAWLGHKPITIGDWTNFLTWASAGVPNQTWANTIKIWFLGGRISYTVRNNSLMPHDIIKYTIVARQNIPRVSTQNDLTTLSTFPTMTGSNPAFIQTAFTENIGITKMSGSTAIMTYTDPHVVPTDSQLFTRYWKITRSVKKTMAPGALWNFTIKIKPHKFPGNLADLFNPYLTTSTANNWEFHKKYNKFMYLFKCMGEIGKGATSGVGLTAGNMMIECVRRFKVAVVKDNTLATGVWDTTASTYNAVGAVQAVNPELAVVQAGV